MLYCHSLVPAAFLYEVTLASAPQPRRMPWHTVVDLTCACSLDWTAALPTATPWTLTRARPPQACCRPRLGTASSWCVPVADAPYLGRFCTT